MSSNKSNTLLNYYTSDISWDFVFVVGVDKNNVVMNAVVVIVVLVYVITGIIEHDQ